MINLFELDYGQDEITAVCDVLDSKWLTMGPVTQKFEEEFKTRPSRASSSAVSDRCDEMLLYQ